jgi:hypothetical protein
MNQNNPNQRVLKLIVFITAASFLVWLGVLLLAWIALRAAGIETDFWAMTEALSTAVAVAAIFVAGYVAYREMDEIASSRHLEVADRLFEELNASENVEARRWIFQHLPADPAQGLADLPSEGRDAVKRTLNSLDRISFLTQSGWIPEESIMPWMNPMVVKAWIKLEPYIVYESQRRLEPDYYEGVRRLAERCLAWRAAHLPEAQITWLDDAL